MRFPDSSILIISNEPWGDVWYSKHWYAKILSKNHEVFFINPSPKWKFSNIFSFSAKIVAIDQNLFSVSYKNNFPVFIFKTFFCLLNDILNSCKLLFALPELRKPLAWQFDPVRFRNFFFFPKLQRIYHVTDSFKNLPNNAALSKKVSLIVCTSRQYMEYYSKLNPNTIHIPHGISEVEHRPGASEIGDISKKYGPYVFVCGTISERFNFDLMILLTRKFPERNFLCAGPLQVSAAGVEWKKFELLRSEKNFIHLGIIPGPELKNYISASLVCLVPYKFNLLSDFGGPASSSLKIIQYISQGKAVVSTLKSEIDELEGHGIYFADTGEKFVHLLKQIIQSELSVDNEAYRKYLDSVSYEILIKRIFLSIP